MNYKENDGLRARLSKMALSLRDVLRFFIGGHAKKESAFANEKEAYDFCLKAYKDSGGVTPELRRAFEFYQRNYNDGCEQFLGPEEHPNFRTQ
jgi:hypothetical protein